MGSTNVDAKMSQALNSEQVGQIKEQFYELGISNKTQDLLIKKLQSGKLLDCMIEKKVAEIPVEDLTPTVFCPTKRVVFKDGSVLENKIEIPISSLIKSVLTTDNSIGIQSSMETRFNNVKVSAKNGISGGGFYTDYIIDYKTNDRILNVRDPYCNVIAGNYKDLTLVINRYIENSTVKKAAETTYSANVTYVGGIGGAETLTIKMYIGKDKMKSGILGRVDTIY